MTDKSLTRVIRESLTSQRLETDESILREMGSWFMIIIFALLAAILMNTVVIVNAQITSGSMETTLMTWDRVMGLRTAYWFSSPQRGDIVFFKYPDDESQVFVKRIVGMPGDTVEIKGGVTYINGEALDEPYLNETPKSLNFGPYEVPEGEYFMMGDNRNHSNDSRYWDNTFVSGKKILGKAYWIYYPRFESVNHENRSQSN